MTVPTVTGGLLTAPPFPFVAHAALALDQGPGRGADRATADEAARAMVAARVGGRFWGRQATGRRRLVVLGADDAVPNDGEDRAVVVWSTDQRREAEVAGAIAVDRDVDPWSLIDAAEEVVCRRDDVIGLLALAAGKEVKTLAGTPVREGAEQGGVAAALVGRRYRHSFTGEPIDALAAIGLLSAWRTLIDTNRGLSAATGMAFWKRREVARLLWDGREGRLPFLKPGAAIARAAREGGAVAAWPARVPGDFAERAAAAGVPVRWVEDGFLRSAGLGSDLLPPLSLIVDDLWPYFDPAQPSRLETILEEFEFEPALVARAAALRRTIIERRIGKYRIGGGDEAIDFPPGARLVVVVGQVEDDLSMLRGGNGVTNRAVIERARAAEPDAYIVYRPHPDVEAGHRKGAVPDAVALRFVDRIDRGGSLDALLAHADTLHTITSLSGFEALMRGVRVVVHGSPFYAGWGLTDDRGPLLPRRTRRLTLDQLVAGALILYPRYLDARTGLPCTPEQFIEGLGGVGVHAGWLVRLRRWQGWLMRRIGAR